MLSKIVLAAIAGVVAYLICVFVGGLLVSVNAPIATAVGTFLVTFATLISILVFLYYAFAGKLPL